MERRTPIFIIASPRPRVGKTLLARMLAEFFRSEDRPVSAFDCNPGEFALVDYLPGYTAVADIADTRNQITLFDQLLADDHVPKVVDLGHSLFDKFFTVIQQIGFAEEARRRGAMPVVLFLPDGDRRSRQGYAVLRERFAHLPIVPVINEALPQAIRFRDDFPGTATGGAPLTIPALAGDQRRDRAAELLVRRARGDRVRHHDRALRLDAARVPGIPRTGVADAACRTAAGAEIHRLRASAPRTRPACAPARRAS